MSSDQLLNALFFALWILAPILQAAMAVVLRRKKLDREFPFFFKYLVFQTVINIVLFAVQTRYRVYFYAYSTFAAISTVLEFGIIYEIFSHLFRPYPYLRDFAKVIFRWAGTLLVLIAVLIAATAAQGQEERVFVVLMWTVRSVRLVQCGLVFFLLYFCSYLGITRRHYLFGVALGFGTLASAELAVVAVRMLTGNVGSTWFNVVLLAAADWAVVIWGIYFLSRPPVKHAAETPAIAAGQQWDRGVADLLYPQSEPGLLSRIDRLVEDAFAHSRAAKSPIADVPGTPVPPPTSSH